MIDTAAVHLQLAHLGSAYFHQDYDLDAPTPLDVIRQFRRDEPPQATRDLASEIQAIIGSAMTGTQFYNLWIKECGASYDPQADGIPYRTWFTEVLHILTTG